MTNAAANQNQGSMQKPLPVWIVSGVLGVMLGGGATFLGLQYYGYGQANQAAAATSSGGPPPGMAGGMGGGGMGGGGMGGGGMGGGGGSGSRGKRNLTTLVGKLDLASKGIPFQLEADQSAKLASQLKDLEQPETMTQEEAQDRCDALEAMLTEEQKTTLALFELPRAGRGGAGGGGAGRGGMAGGMGGPPGGMAGPPPTMAGGMAGPPPAMGGPPGGMGGGAGGAAPDDSNPFQEEANQTRLHSLLERLHAGSETAGSGEKSE